MYHQYSPVAVSVDTPELYVGLGSDGRGPWGTIDQSQLSKAAAFTNAGDPLTVNIHLLETNETSCKNTGHDMQCIKY